MIELKEKANNYAEENVMSVLKEAFAKVYADGYRDGYKDYQDEIPVDLRNNQTEFVDLGLPSGTLWAKDYEQSEGKTMYLPYCQANGMGIPTEELWNELLEHCKWQGIYSSTGVSFYGVSCIGPNGNVIKFRSKGFMKDNKVIDDIEYGGGQVYFWLLDNEVNNNHNKTIVTIERGLNRNPDKQISKIFSGYKLPIRLVKTK